MAVDLLREGRKIVHCDWGLEGNLESHEDYNEFRETEKLSRSLSMGQKLNVYLKVTGLDGKGTMVFIVNLLGEALGKLTTKSLRSYE